MVFLLAWVRALGRLLRRDGSVQEPARKLDHHCPSREGERVQKLVRTIALDTHEPGCVGGPVARRGEAAERAACRSTSPGGIAVPGALPGFGLVAVTGRRWLLQALSGFPVAARVDSLAGGAGVALAPVPAEEDQVVEESGAQVFLEPHAAEALDDKVLDAEIEGGEVRFAVGEQS